jgi:hypothetical protein
LQYTFARLVRAQTDVSSNSSPFEALPDPKVPGVTHFCLPGMGRGPVQCSTRSSVAVSLLQRTCIQTMPQHAVEQSGLNATQTEHFSASAVADPRDQATGTTGLASMLPLQLLILLIVCVHDHTLGLHRPGLKTHLLHTIGVYHVVCACSVVLVIRPSKRLPPFESEI